MRSSSGTTPAANVTCSVLCGGLQEQTVDDNKGIYELLNPDVLDGLIVSANIAYTITPESFRRYLDILQASMPVVGVVTSEEGMSSVLVDGFSGMYDAVKHLIETHGHRRIAFIRGPVGQVDADERYRAYTTALEDHNIPLNPDWVGYGINVPTGRTRCELPRMIDMQSQEVHRSPWAVVAANDDMARGALEVLYEYGLRVPEDVAVVGFDDSDIVRNLDVPVTTVRQPIYAMGRRAVRLLLQRLRGDLTLAREMVPANGAPSAGVCRRRYSKLARRSARTCRIVLRSRFLLLRKSRRRYGRLFSRPCSGLRLKRVRIMSSLRWIRLYANHSLTTGVLKAGT